MHITSFYPQIFSQPDKWPANGSSAGSSTEPIDPDVVSKSATTTESCPECTTCARVANQTIFRDTPDLEDLFSSISRHSVWPDSGVARDDEQTAIVADVWERLDNISPRATSEYAAAILKAYGSVY